MRTADLPTPALVVDVRGLDANVATMASAWPGPSLRTHVKAFKSTGLARRLANAGHQHFCCATVREMVGMATAGLGTDLLLANEVPDPARLAPLGDLVSAGVGRITVAVDSDVTIEAAAAAGVGEVLIDVNVGMPRCGCQPDDAGRLAELARSRGLGVRGVMGYEGHVTIVESRPERQEAVDASMELLRGAHAEVGGDVLSGGATVTWDLNTTVTELQAGTFTLMDTAFARIGVPFVPAVALLGTVVSRNRVGRGYAVADVGLKSLGMDHGNPSVDGATVWLCSDEHLTFGPPGRDEPDGPGWPVEVGDRVLVWPAHLDPTVAMHERMHVVELPDRADDDPGGGWTAWLDAEVVDTWPVDLRHW